MDITTLDPAIKYLVFLKKNIIRGYHGNTWNQLTLNGKNVRLRFELQFGLVNSLIINIKTTTLPKPLSRLLCNSSA